MLASANSKINPNWGLGVNRKIIIAYTSVDLQYFVEVIHWFFGKTPLISTR